MPKPFDELKNAVRKIALSLDDSVFRLIDTTRDFRAIIDAKYESKARKVRWFASASGEERLYAVGDVGGKRLSLQRFILSLEHPEQHIDDIKHVSFLNKVTLDCRVSNLTRRASRQTVMQNRKPKRNTSSAFKGVILVQRKDGGVAWKTQIKGHLGSMSIGTFKTERQAALHYDAAAYVLFQDTGYYNFPDDVPDLEALDNVLLRIEKRKRFLEKSSLDRGHGGLVAEQ